MAFIIHQRTFFVVVAMNTDISSNFDFKVELKYILNCTIFQNYHHAFFVCIVSLLQVSAVINMGNNYDKNHIVLIKLFFSSK